MTSRTVTILIWAMLALLLVVLDLLGRVPVSRVPTFNELITRVMRTPSGRVGVLAGWLWIGLHYFAR
jgi:hypothetical protein